MNSDVVDEGGRTLWAAIAQMEPGVQVAFIVLVLVCLGLSRLVWYLLSELKANRTADREKDALNRQQFEQIIVALAVLKERVGTG